MDCQKVNAKIVHTIFIFGGLSIIILLLFQLEKWSLFALGASENTHLVLSGMLFLVVGMVVSKYLIHHPKSSKKTRIKSNLSDQEFRVLQLISDGHSNKEIAAQLHIAESTVKSHVSNILAKFNAKRRTEAVKIGRELQII